MRTLKKTLCLVLVLAMMVGLCAVGASAAKLDDYSDKDKIENTEAVAILSALGVLEGDERGFRPADTLTRAEGAAIMTRLHATTGAGSSSYTDMGSAAWAQPYVAYCEQQGIIAGYGDGRFGPQDTLTVAQFAKMLLCALGYDAGMEGLTGASWEINVVKLINKIDLAAGLPTLDYNAAITRDQAAQLAYNTLKANMVEYNGAVKVTTNDGTKVEVGANAKNIGNTAYTYTDLDKTYKTVGTMQFCENYFPTLKATVANDDFGVLVNKWFLGNTRTDNTWTEKKAVTSAPVGTVLKTYSTGLARVSYATLYTDAGFTGTDNKINFIANNSKAVDTAINRGDTKQTLKDYAGGTAMLVKIGKDLTGSAADQYYLYIKYPFLAQVNDVVAATAAADRSVALKVWTGLKATETGKTAITADAKFETELFAKRDFVLVYPEGDVKDTCGKTELTIIDATAAESVSGNLSAYSTSPVVAGAVTGLTTDSTKYDLSANAFYGNTAAPAVNKSVTAFLSNGYIMGSVAAIASASDYVFVLGNTPTGSAFGGNESWTAGYVKQDATTDTAAATKRLVGDDKVTGTGWYTMSAAGGKYAFTAPEEIVNNPVKAENAKLTTTTTDGKTTWSIKPTVPAIASGIIANDNTVFVIRSGKLGTFASYTGIKNVPAFTGEVTEATPAPTARALLIGGYAAAIYLDLGTATPIGAAATPIYLLNPNYTSYREAAGVKYYTYSVIMDGEVKTVEYANGTVSVGQAGLIVPTFDKDGYLTDATLAGEKQFVVKNAYEVGKDTVTYSAGVLKVGTESFNVAADAVVYVYDTTTFQLTKSDAESVAGKAGYLTVVETSASNPSIKTIYFVK